AHTATAATSTGNTRRAHDPTVALSSRPDAYTVAFLIGLKRAHEELKPLWRILPLRVVSAMPHNLGARPSPHSPAGDAPRGRHYPIRFRCQSIMSKTLPKCSKRVFLRRVSDRDHANRRRRCSNRHGFVSS